MTVRHLASLTRGAVRTLAADGAVAVLPIGAVEQHGDHLPLGTDFLLVEAVCDRALQHLQDDGTTWVRMPTMTFGHSPHHLFAAAVSLRPGTLSDVLADVLDSLAQTGFRRIVIVNGHGGNDELVRLAVKAHSLRAEGTAAACSYWTLTAETTAEAAAAERPDRTPGHAGWFETSLMLAVHPELVADERPFTPADPPPLFNRSPAPGLTVERHGEWPRVGGTTDDAREASAQTGRLLLGRRVAGLVAALQGLDRATATPRAASVPSTDRERGPHA
ncbi:creatininase family protein [Mycolicibacterium goodii]|uniref:Creatinine amidohydrolase n=1 Tax=Mycolicibacterium goodii TaxID=134601 RepID=A0A0K0X2B8_MYCGD|nr:creatinine amidohydrolase [Mycolicibacterium goodii]